MLEELQLQLTKTLDLSRVLEIAVSYGADYLPADACSIRLAEGNYLSAGIAIGFDSSARRDHRVLIDGLIDPVFSQRQVLRISDLDRMGTSASWPQKSDAKPLRAYLGVPLTAGEEVIGLMSFYREQSEDWSDEEVDQAQAIAHAAGPSVHRAQLYQEAQEKAGRLETLQDIVKALNSVRTSHQMFGVIASHVSRIVRNDRISVALYDPETDKFSLAAVAITTGVTSLTTGTLIPAQDTEMAKIVQTHQSILIDDLAASTKRMDASLYCEGIRALAAVPILSDSECIGCISVGSRQVAAYAPNHLELLSAVSDHLAIAIRNIRLYDALREAQEYTDQILQTTPDAILALNKEFQIREFNHAAEALFGTRKAAVVGTRLVDLFPVEFRPDMESLLQQTLAGTPVAPQETYLRDPSEILIPVRLVLAAHKDSAGAVHGIVGILRDLSKERSLEERLSYSERLRMLGELASGVAHNLNNSLFPITAYAQELLDAAENTEDRELLELIMRAAWDCSSTVKRIQSFAATHIDTEFCRVDVSQVVKDALDFTRSRWRSEAQAHGVQIQVTMDHQSVPPVNGSEAELKEVLANLVFNAVDAMLDTGGDLYIGLADDGRDVHITVRDTGSGMTEEVRLSAFEPFFTTKGERGTGLGLRTAYSLISRHSGTIEITDTSPGRGTTFHISLPIDLDAPEPEQEHRLATLPTTILVVDDDPEICDLIAGHLEGDGHQVYRTTSGEEALILFKQEHPQVVFTDLSMPDMSGWDLARQVKQIAPNTGIALITGWGTQRLDQRDIEESRIDLVLGKPLRDYHVLNAVARLSRC